MPHGAESWPLPVALTIDQCLRDLTQHHGFTIDEDNVDVTLVDRPDLIVAWVHAASRYTAADYLLRILSRSIGWMRDEIAPDTGWDDDALIEYTAKLHELLNERGRQIAERDPAYRGLQLVCQILQAEGLLRADPVRWREIDLVAADLAVTVQIPADATSPWPLVKANEALLNRLADANLDPRAGQPVVRRQSHGFVRLDHQGHQHRLLPDPSGDYWLRGFAWTSA